MLSAVFTFAWSALFVVGLVVEAVALKGRAKGDTLSEHVWLIRSRVWGRPLLYAAWCWLSWHFIVEEPFDNARAHWWDDWTVLAVGAVVGAVFAVRLRRKVKAAP